MDSITQSMITGLQFGMRQAEAQRAQQMQAAQLQNMAERLRLDRMQDFRSSLAADQAEQLHRLKIKGLETSQRREQEMESEAGRIFNPASVSLLDKSGYSPYGEQIVSGLMAGIEPMVKSDLPSVTMGGESEEDVTFRDAWAPNPKYQQTFEMADQLVRNTGAITPKIDRNAAIAFYSKFFPKELAALSLKEPNLQIIPKGAVGRSVDPLTGEVTEVQGPPADPQLTHSGKNIFQVTPGGLVPLYKGEEDRPYEIKGFEKSTNKAVYLDKNTNRLVYNDGTNYMGGQLTPITEPGTVTVQNLTGVQGFEGLPQPTKEQWYEQFTLTGKVPPFAFRDIQGRQAFIKGWADYQAQRGAQPGDAATTQAAYTALKSSLGLQEKTRGMMGAFVNNIDKQIARVQEIMEDSVSRIGLRGADVPIRELKTRFVGSGHERVLESYLMEISREIGKLSTGSQASVAELSVSAQEKWDKIHDPNLTFKELNEVLKATREQAKFRVDSADKEINYTTMRLKGLSRATGYQEKPALAKPKTWKNINGVWKQE